MRDLQQRFPLYSKLLKLYPETYRSAYEREVLQTTADMLDDTNSRVKRLIIWSHVAFDLPFSLSKQRLQYVGGIIQNETPNYIKRNGLIAGILLLPFFIALIANSLDKVINNHTLYHSWLWNFPTIGFWVLWLPEIALLLTIISIVIYLINGNGKKQSSWWKRALDLKHSWPVVIPAFLAFGILFILAFHDSTQC